jgi:hypothetical protein
MEDVMIWTTSPWPKIGWSGSRILLLLCSLYGIPSNRMRVELERNIRASRLPSASVIPADLGQLTKGCHNTMLTEFCGMHGGR